MSRIIFNEKPQILFRYLQPNPAVKEETHPQNMFLKGNDHIPVLNTRSPGDGFALNQQVKFHLIDFNDRLRGPTTENLDHPGCRFNKFPDLMKGF